MQRGRLNERYVQQVALETLSSHYASRPDDLSVFSLKALSSVSKTSLRLGTGISNPCPFSGSVRIPGRAA